MREWYVKNKVAERKKRRDRPSTQKEARAAQRRTDGAQATTKAYNVNYAASTKGRSRYLLLSAKKRALRHGLPFDITFEDIVPHLERGTCQRTGLEFDLSPAKCKGGPRPFSPSLDQVFPRKGYVRGNVEVVCWIYNICKSDFDEVDIRKFAKALAAKL